MLLEIQKCALTMKRASWCPCQPWPLLADTLERAWERREDWQRMGQAGPRARAESIIPKDPITLFADKLRSCGQDSGGSSIRESEPGAAGRPVHALTHRAPCM